MKTKQHKRKVKLSNHFDSNHKNLTPLERREYINNVKVIPRREVNWPVLRVTKGQRTLEQFIKPPTPVTSEEEDVRYSSMKYHVYIGF